MSVTPPGPLVRSNYLAATTGDADPNSSTFDPSNVIPPDGFPLYGDLALDTEQYQRPIERLHGSGLHGFGIANGLQIVCTTGQPGVTVLPGIALDPAGRHIYLAAGGSAEIGPSADVPHTPADLAPVTANGVELPTAGYTGTLYVVVQWRETWDAASYASDPNINQYMDTPWLQLVAQGGYLPDYHVVLGKVVLDAASNVTSASYGDSPGLQRTSVSLPAQSLELYRAITTPAPGADTMKSGEVRAGESGGIEIAVASNTDQITVLSDAGGSFSNFVVGANQATVGDRANPGIILNGQLATVKVGALGNYGDVLVYDGNGHLSVSLIGDTGHVIVGGKQLAGEVRMLNTAAQDTMSLNGQIGAAVLQRLQAFSYNVIDVDANVRIHGTDLSLDGRSHKNNRALVDGGGNLIINYAGDYQNGVEINGNGLKVDGVLTDGKNVPLMGNPARKVTSATLIAESSLSGGEPSTNFNTLDVDFGAHTQFTATVAICYIQEYVSVTYNAQGVAEIWQVDGNDTGVVSVGGPLGNTYAPVVTTAGSTVTFRLRTNHDSIALMASIVVFYE